MDNTKDIDSSFIKDGSSCSTGLTEEEQAKILYNFSITIIGGQKNPEPKYQNLVSEHFWGLI